MNDLQLEEIMQVIRWAQKCADDEQCKHYIVCVSSCIFVSRDKNSGRVLETIQSIREQSKGDL